MEIAIELNPDRDPSMPTYMSLLTGKTVVRMNDIADLITQFTPMLAGAGLLPIEGEPGAYKFSSPNPQVPVSIFLYTLTDSNDLLLSLSETGKDWFLDNGSSIGDSPEFLKIVEGLPTEGISFMYTSKRLSEMQIAGLGEGAAEAKELAPLLTTLETFLKRYTGAQAAVSFIEGNALRSTARQPISYKTNLAISAGIVPATLAATIVPIMQKKMGTPPPAQETDPDTSPID